MKSLKNITKHLVRGALGILLAGTASGCFVEPPPMILVRGATALSSDCVADADPSSFLGVGLIDVALNREGYTLFPNVENIAPASASTGPTSSGGGGGQSTTWPDMSGETNRVILSSAIVDFSIKTADVPSSVSSQFVGLEIPISGMLLEPSGGRASVRLDVVNSAQVAGLKAVLAPGQTVLIEARVRLRGTTTGDRDVESNEFIFPIEICNGCLIDPSCIQGEETTTVCKSGQDVATCTGVAPDTGG